MFAGIITLSEFCKKYRMNEQQKTELITMQAFYQGVAILLGMALALIGEAVVRWSLSVM